MAPNSFLIALVCAVGAVSTPILWDGRAPLNFTAANLDGSVEPYLTSVIVYSGITMILTPQKCCQGLGQSLSCAQHSLSFLAHSDKYGSILNSLAEQATAPPYGHQSS